MPFAHFDAGVPAGLDAEEAATLILSWTTVRSATRF